MKRIDVTRNKTASINKNERRDGQEVDNMEEGKINESWSRWGVQRGKSDR